MGLKSVSYHKRGHGFSQIRHKNELRNKGTEPETGSVGRYSGTRVRPMDPGKSSIRQSSIRRPGTSVPHYDDEKLSRIRNKIRIVFGIASSMKDSRLSNRHDLSDNGDLILILR